MLKTSLIILGFTACLMAATDVKQMKIDYTQGKIRLEPPSRGPSDTKWELTTCDHCKMVMTCVLNDMDCSTVSIKIWDGVKTWDGCEEQKMFAFNNSVNNQMSVQIKTTGSKYPAQCHVTATKPYIGYPEEAIDSTEHGLETEKNEDCRCGWSNKNGGQRIVGGKEAKVNEYPFPVLIIKTRTKYPFCGGSIITPWHVLTAAHCTNPYKRLRLSVLVGEHDIRTDKETSATQIIDVEKSLIHPNYTERPLRNDISIIFLKKEIQFNDHVGPVCMPDSIRSLVGQQVKVMGWGLTTHEGDASDVLLKVNLKVIDPDVCEVIYRTNPKENTQFCSYGDSKDSCQGDSGGPLVWLNPRNRFTQVGVVSFGRDCASTDPGVNTNVAAFMDWIKEEIANTKPQRLCH